MIVASTDFITNKKIVEVLGMVKGNVIQAKHIGKDIVASFRQIIGGEIKEYTEMFSEAREISLKRFYPEIIANQTVKAYQKVLEEK